MLIRAIAVTRPVEVKPVRIIGGYDVAIPAERLIIPSNIPEPPTRFTTTSIKRGCQVRTGEVNKRQVFVRSDATVASAEPEHPTGEDSLLVDGCSPCWH